MKILSFCLWGSNPRYLIPLLINSQLMGSLYPGWKMVLFAAHSVNQEYLERLRQNGVMVFLCGESSDKRGMFWRHKAINIKEASVIVFRDADTVLTERDRFIVDLWLESDKLFYTCRDHPAHKSPIMAGIWGAREEGINYISHVGLYEPEHAKYSDDERFLAQAVYHHFKQEFLVFSSYKILEGETCATIPMKRQDAEDFLGHAGLTTRQRHQYRAVAYG